MREASKWSARAAGVVLCVVIGGAAAVSCSADSLTGGFKDLEDIRAEDPTDVRLYNNVDGYANIVVLCTDGVAWATTTREGFAALQRVEDLDRTCTGYEAS